MEAETLDHDDANFDSRKTHSCQLGYFTDPLFSQLTVEKRRREIGKKNKKKTKKPKKGPKLRFLKTKIKKNQKRPRIALPFFS
jgi:hypothetical protein